MTNRIRAAILVIGIGFAVFVAWNPTIEATTSVEPGTAATTLWGIFNQASPPIVHAPLEPFPTIPTLSARRRVYNRRLSTLAKVAT